MATPVRKRRNKSVKMITTIQYLSRLDDIKNAILKVDMMDNDYTLVSYDPVLRITHLMYEKRMVMQNIYIILKEVDVNKTNVTIEVINDKSMVITNYDHKMRLNYVIGKITNELNMV